MKRENVNKKVGKRWKSEVYKEESFKRNQISLAVPMIIVAMAAIFLYIFGITPQKYPSIKGFYLFAGFYVLFMSINLGIRQTLHNLFGLRN